MIKSFIFRTLYQYACFRDVVIQKSEQPVKILTGCLLLITAASFLLDYYQIIDLPDFRKTTEYDSFAWVGALSALAIAQLVLLRCSGSLKCRIWGAFLLQISGVALVAVGGVFIAEYPPFNHLMTFYTVGGLVIGWHGIGINKRARQQFRKENGARVCNGII